MLAAAFDGKNRLLLAFAEPASSLPDEYLLIEDLWVNRPPWIRSRPVSIGSIPSSSPTYPSSGTSTYALASEDRLERTILSTRLIGFQLCRPSTSPAFFYSLRTPCGGLWYFLSMRIPLPRFGHNGNGAPLSPLVNLFRFGPLPVLPGEYRSALFEIRVGILLSYE